MANIKTFKPRVQFNQNRPSDTKPDIPNQRSRYSNQPKDGKGSLKLIPLGGVGDVTKNMYVYEYGNDIIVIDCGIGFPDEGMPGIDLVIPDISYLKDKVHKIRGIVITHGHDDHIGGLPYLWPQLKAPIYAQKLAAGFIRSKFTENNLPKGEIKTIDLNTVLNLGAFKLTFYRVAHSVPDATGVVIETPVGRILHQADFKIDWTPVNGQTTDVQKVAVNGEKGILLMLIDGLSVDKPGYNLSERTIQPTFEEITAKTQGKVLITTTSSNITRIQQAVNVAVKFNRKVAFVGRSMDSNSQVARDLGYLDVPPNLIIAPEEIKRMPDNKLLILIAGSQGQPDSSLSRAVNNAHKFVTLKKNDAVVFSADPIPSSESAQYALIDKITKMGVDAYYSGLGDTLHVSGHARAEEIKLMINLAKPKYIMPIGATFRGMKVFSTMAQGMGYQENEVLTVEDGQILNVYPNRVEVGKNIGTHNVYVDGLSVGDISNVVLRDRMVMAEEGIVLVIVPVDARTSKIVGEADIVSRGFVFEKESEDLLQQAKNVVKSALADHPDSILDWRFTRRHIEENLEKFFYQETKRRPMILPVVVEV